MLLLRCLQSVRGLQSPAILICHRRGSFLRLVRSSGGVQEEETVKSDAIQSRSFPPINRKGSRRAQELLAEFELLFFVFLLSYSITLSCREAEKLRGKNRMLNCLTRVGSLASSQSRGQDASEWILFESKSPCTARKRVFSICEW